MRTCLGIVCGLIFLLAAGIFLVTFNLNKTVYNPTFIKNTAISSGFYQNVPGIVIDLISKSKIEGKSDKESEAIKNMLIDTIRTAITPATLQKHSESLIDQTLSDKNMVTEDLSDINGIINAKMGANYGQDIGLPLEADSNNAAIPDSVTFDKSKSPLGKSVIIHKKVLWISLAVSILFLILLFFSSSRSYKSRFKWVGGFLIPLALYAAINFIVLFLINVKLIINYAAQNVSTDVPAALFDQVIKIADSLKNKLAFYNLYEFIFFIAFLIFCFVIAALIKSKNTPAYTPPAAASAPQPAGTVKPTGTTNG